MCKNAPCFGLPLLQHCSSPASIPVKALSISIDSGASSSLGFKSLLQTGALVDRKSRLLQGTPAIVTVVESSPLAESKDAFNESARNETLGVVTPVDGCVIEEAREVVLTLLNDRVRSVSAALPTWHEGTFALGIADPISLALWDRE